MTKGYGFDVDDKTLLIVLGIGAYFLYKDVIKPVAGVTEAIGGSVSAIARLPNDIITGGETVIKDIYTGIRTLFGGGDSGGITFNQGILSPAPTGQQYIFTPSELPYLSTGGMSLIDIGNPYLKW